MNKAIPDDTHVFRMTDCTGMLQHARNGVPDPSEGYTTDDNARALVMADLLYETSHEKKYLDLAYRYLGFLLNAQSGGRFRNFMDYNRNFLESEGSPDCFGRCILCLGFTAESKGMPENIRQTAAFLLEQVKPGCAELRFLRSKAYALMGLCFRSDAQSGSMVRKLAGEIAGAFEQNSGNGWHWFEDSMTYCNAVLPWSLLCAYERTGETDFLNAGLDSLNFLLSKTFAGEIFRPIGCKGWLRKGGTPAEYDEQPVEACGTLLACLKAHRLTGDERYRKCAEACLGWYTGKNSGGLNMIDPETGGCMDGIKPDGPNRNEGAESIVCWMIASLTMARAECAPRSHVTGTQLKKSACAARIPTAVGQR